MSEYLLILCTFFFGCSSRDAVLKVYNGRSPAADTPTAWNTVQIRSGSHYCSGSLIATNTILTAAHCVSGAKPEEILVIFGDDIQDGAQVASAIETYSSYGDKFFPNLDIAKVYLSQPVPENFRPIDVRGMSTVPLLAGYGATESCPNGLCQPHLMEAFTTVVNKFQSPHGFQLFSTKSKAEDNEGSPCFGDSGGPVYETLEGRWYLVGITNGASLIHTPLAFDDKSQINCNNGWGLHTNLEFFKTWIAGDGIEGLDHNVPGSSMNWQDWLGFGVPGDSGWYTVDRILQYLALQPNINGGQIIELIQNPKWSRAYVESLAAMNLKSPPSNQFYDSSITDLKPLASFSGLRTLSLNDIRATDYTPISHLPLLSRLSVVCSESTPSLHNAGFDQVITERNKLNLTLIGCSGADINQLKWPNQLQSLSISKANGSPLVSNGLKLSTIENLRLSGLTISDSFAMPEVRSVTLENLDVKTSLSLLWGRPITLMSLTVKNTKVLRLTDAMSTGSENLDELSLYNTSTTDYSGLENFSNLRKLVINDNMELQVLPIMPWSLKTLDISRTSIWDLSQLRDRHELVIIAKDMASKESIACPEGVVRCEF